MSESIIESRSEMDAPRSRIAAAATLAVAMAAGLAAWGTFGGSDHEAGEYLVVLAIIAVAAAVVFGWIVPRALRRESAGTTALVLSVLGLATIAIFWSGLPPVLAAGGIVLGWAGRGARTGPGLSTAAIVLGVLALAADVAVYVQDMAF
jgi:hypothetical protein